VAKRRKVGNLLAGRACWRLEIAGQRESLTQNSREVPRLFLVEAEYDLAIREAETTWIRSLLDVLTTGSLPGLEQCRAWHQAGLIPPELADLAERGSTRD
jgi:hypothetical protein